MMIKMLLFLALPFLAAGCVVHGHGRGHVHGPALSIEAGHVHSAHCGHYHWNGGWYHRGGHVHGHGCGHHYRSGVWVHID